ncbi:uncharacterized serine-rich protein C215.13-like isoform X1 [Musa acuminata AAA Group]|uniref:uncharacterized serine-rich protein C215.13-like isoform X1 n=1 Tax=Musa acuminata AAA Group TaxID=214697 RepID=UPI0031DB53F3
MEIIEMSPEAATMAQLYSPELRIEGSAVAFVGPCLCFGIRKRRCLRPTTRSRKKLLVYDLPRSPPSPPPPHAIVASLSRFDLSPRSSSPFPSAYRLSLSSPLPSPSSSSSTTSSLTHSPSSSNSPGTPGSPFVRCFSPRLASHLEPIVMISPSSSPPTFLFATLPEPSESTASPSSSGPDEATTSPVEKNKKASGEEQEPNSWLPRSRRGRRRTSEHPPQLWHPSFSGDSPSLK